MRLYLTLAEAMSEIQRDIAKGPKLTSTRVQQRVHQELPGRELLGYSYSLEAAGIPDDAAEIIQLGRQLGFKTFSHDEKQLAAWFDQEVYLRISGQLTSEANELDHPALASTLEGNWPAYTYQERLVGMLVMMTTTLSRNPDSRRAYWPIYRAEDAFRAMAPTRIPCSLGYQALIRQTINGPRLIFIYSQRSADFDTFLLSDIYLASQLQKYLAKTLRLEAGPLIHMIHSLHSFAVEGTEVY